jgi:predicted ATPase
VARAPVDLLAGPQLASVRYEPPEGATGFPFSVPSVATLTSLDFGAPVTLFVGENGSGKSTLLEGLGVAAELPAVGTTRLARDPTLEAQRALARRLRLTWRARTRRGFFLRAEDFFGFQKSVAQARAEALAEMERIDREMASHSDYGRTLAKGPHASSLADMERRYGADPDAGSHGEAFLRLFGSRLVPGGLYLLDEPEAALSPQSQLAFLAMVKDAVDAGSQFIVATHSPILMATPGATILSFDAPPVRAVAYDDLDAVRLVRDFLQAPERFLRHVWGDPDAPPQPSSPASEGSSSS